MLLRGDTERAQPYDFHLDDLTSVSMDWHYERIGRIAWSALGVPRAAVRYLPPVRPYGQKLVEWTFEIMARMNVRQGRALLRPGGIVLTDRLHAAVLGVLMGKPVVVLDNSYGKIAPIYADYLQTLPHIYFARDAAEARRLVLQVHAEPRTMS